MNLKRAAAITALTLVSVSSSQSALTVTNGLMTNAGIGTLNGWSNNASGGFEGKTDTLAGGANDNFGALVFNGVGGGTTTGTTNNDWTGIVAGSAIRLDFELFNERLVDANGATDMLAELLIGGAVKSSISLLRSAETFDNTQTRTLYSAPSYTLLAADIGDQVEVRFTATAADQAWHQTGIDNVALTVTPVPEPSVLAIFVIGGIALILRRRK